MASTTEIIANTSFSMLRGKVGDKLLDAIDSMGFTQPTEIQAKSLPHLLLGKDLIGAAKTGSGKTLAFLIPVVEHLTKLNFLPKHGTGCIILSPTRELALQTYTVLEKILKTIPLTSALVIGGMKKPQEIKALIKGRSIVVATPGRLLDHLRTTAGFNVQGLRVLVMDEADKLLEAGFERHITGIIKLLPRERQTVLFSATITDRIENLARLAMVGERVYVSVSDNQVASTVSGLKQGYFICPVEHRISWLFRMLKKTKKQKVMVFFSSCKSVDFHTEFFKTHCQAPILSIHGRQTQPRRKASFEAFVGATTGALFCTDVAARGLDIPFVDWIIQYDPPTDPKEYIHRVGRTARGAEATGNAVLLLRPEERAFLEFLRRERATLDKFTLDDEPGDCDVQRMMENLVSTNGVFKTLAKGAYIAFLRSYRSHPMRKVFDIKTLDFKLTGKAFGFLDPPHVDMGNPKRRQAVVWSCISKAHENNYRFAVNLTYKVYLGVFLAFERFLKPFIPLTI